MNNRNSIAAAIILNNTPDRQDYEYRGYVRQGKRSAGPYQINTANLI